MIVILLGFIYYYVALPAVNIHESGFWVFLGGLVLLILVIYGFRKRVTSIYQLRSDKVLKGEKVEANYPVELKLVVKQ